MGLTSMPGCRAGTDFESRGGGDLGIGGKELPERSMGAAADVAGGHGSGHGASNAGSEAQSKAGEKFGNVEGGAGKVGWQGISNSSGSGSCTEAAQRAHHRDRDEQLARKLHEEEVRLAGEGGGQVVGKRKKAPGGPLERYFKRQSSRYP